MKGCTYYYIPMLTDNLRLFERACEPEMEGKLPFRDGRDVGWFTPLDSRAARSTSTPPRADATHVSRCPCARECGRRRTWTDGTSLRSIRRPWCARMSSSRATSPSGRVGSALLCAPPTACSRRARDIGTIVHPKATIFAIAGPIVIGTGCIVEEGAIIVNRCVCPSPRPRSAAHQVAHDARVRACVSRRKEVMRIGDDNLFEIGCRACLLSFVLPFSLSLFLSFFLYFSSSA